MNALISWTSPSHCGVCRGFGLVSFRWDDGRLAGSGVAACPHSTSPRTAIPILSVPLRRDVPRSAAA